MQAGGHRFDPGTLHGSTKPFLHSLDAGITRLGEFFGEFGSEDSSQHESDPPKRAASQVSMSLRSGQCRSDPDARSGLRQHASHGGRHLLIRSLAIPQMRVNPKGHGGIGVTEN